MTRSCTRRLRLVLLASGAIVACSGRPEAPKTPLGSQAGAGSADRATAVEAAHALLGPAAKAALDSGNMLFRKKAYDAALAQYRSASVLAPQHSAPLFGIYMVGRATNDSALADSALAGIRLRGGSMTASPHPQIDTGTKRFHDGLTRKPSAG